MAAVVTSISAERSRLANVGMTLRRREQWGARRSYTDARTVSEPATKQFVHITVTNPGNYSSFDRHAQAIEAIGISRFPNTGISYNRLFMAGTRNVYEAQPIGRRGAHTVNDFRRSTCSLSGCPSRGTSLAAPSWNLNYNARAYAYASNVGFSVPDHVIDDMARSMAADRLAGFVTRNATIHGHRCVSAKSCPGDKMWERMHDLERRVEHYLEDDMPTAKEVADEVIRQLTYDVSEDDTIAKIGLFAAGRTLQPESGLAYGWGYAKDNRRTLRQVLAELAEAKAERAAQRELLVQLAGQQSGVELTDEQVATIAQRIAEAGEGACQQVLDRLAAAGDALADDG